MSRRLLPPLLLALLSSVIAFGTASPQSYPARPIKLIVPFPAGGPPDALARLVAHQVSTRLGQSVVIDNRPGAGAALGTRAAANAEPDGYTLLLASTTSLSIAPLVFKSLDYDPVKSFAPVASVSLGAMVLTVAAGVPARTLEELIAYARANPGKLNNGSGVGSPPHLAWALFTRETAAEIAHVPYRSMAQAMTDLAAGQIQMMIDATGSLLPLIRDGKVRALAVTGASRSADLPHVPTMIEHGYSDFLLTFWTGVLAPAGTPAAIVARLNAAINEGLASSEMRESLANFSVEPKVGSPSAFAAFMASEAAKWAEIVKSTGVKIAE
jgi:tripartite-type tricarboxylate transporter receptor subunit TctC